MDRIDGPDSGATVQSELARLEREDANRSLLRKAVDFVTEPYHQESAARQKLHEAAFGGSNADEAVKASRAAAQAESDAYTIASGAVKTAGLFVKGKLGFAATAASYALDEIRPNNGHVGLDASLGVAKGIGMRMVLSKVTGAGEGPAMMALKFGTASRFVDSSLTRQNYVNSDGELTLRSFGNGVVNIGKTTFNPIAVGTDVATAGFTLGLAKMAPKVFTGNSFRSMTTMTFANGWANGMAQEGQSQFYKGEFNAARLAAFPLASALATSLAAAPGNQQNYVRNYGLENAATIRNREFKLVAIDASDVRNIAKGGSTGSEVTVKPISEGLLRGDAETIQVRRQNLPTDWLAAIGNGFGRTRIGPAGEQLRFMSRSGPDAPWEMAVTRGTTTVSDLIKSHSSYHQGTKIGPFLKDLQEPLTRFLGSGSESGAFRMANGAVLKTASSLPSDKINDWGNLPGDARALFSPMKLNVAEKGGDMQSILVQEPLKTPVTEAQAAALRKQMDKDGVHFWDYNYSLMGEQVSYAVDQVGLNAFGKPVILDYGARRKSWNYDAHKIQEDAAKK